MKHYNIDDLHGTIDFAIITIRDDEYIAILDRFLAPDSAENERGYDIGEMETIDGQHYRYAIVRCTKKGQGEAQSVANAIIKDLDPNLLLLVGIGGAIPSDDFTLGDVVCATRVNDYCVSAVKEGKLEEFNIGGGEMHPRIRNLLGRLPKIVQTIPRWNTEAAIGLSIPVIKTPEWDPEAKQYNHAGTLYGSKAWQERVAKSLQGHFPKSEKARLPIATAKAVASSDRVIMATALLRLWLATARDVAAVEMELAGVYAAARAVTKEYPILAVRGISDVVGFKREDQWTKFACAVAASFAWSLVRSGELRGILSPRSEMTGPGRASREQGTVSPDTALHQLRAPIGDFVGREQAIGQLVQALTKAGRTVASISSVRGMGGIGKTELAYMVAQRLTADFPDAQIVVELRGATNLPLPPIQALQTIIHAFEREARLPDDLAELQAIYRSHLSGKRALILADDARDTIQVRPLLPPPGCALLVTSRTRFTLPNIHAIDLSMLSQAEAEQLLLMICPRIGEHASKLAKLCGYLPLALRLSAGLLAANDTRAVARYLDQLKAERLRHLSDPDSPEDPQASVEASLRLSYDALKQVEQRVLRQISIFPASFDLAAAIAVVEGVDDIESALGVLRVRSLLEWNATTERYSLHDLVQVFASVRMEPPEHNSVQQRYSTYYLSLAEQVEPELVGPQQGFRLDQLEKEHDHLRIALQLMLGQGEIETALRLAGALWSFWERRGYINEGFRLFTETLALSKDHLHSKPDFLSIQAKALNGAGMLAAEQADYVQAQALHQKSLELRRMLDDRHGIATSLNNLAMVALYQGDYAESTSLYIESLELFQQIDDRRSSAVVLMNLGIIAQDQGDFSAAITRYREALEIFRAIQDSNSIAMTLGNLGVALRYQYELGQAQAVLEESLALRQSLNDPRGIAFALDNLGWLALDRNDFEEATRQFTESLKLFRDLGTHESIAWELQGLACVAASQNQAEHAARLLGAAEKLREELKAPLPPSEQPNYERIINMIRAQSEEAVFVAEWSAGRALTIDQAIALALGSVA